MDKLYWKGGYKQCHRTKLYGYKQRFGLTYVDYQSLKRVPKDSFAWYAKVIASNGRNLFHKTAVPITTVTAT